MLAAIEETHRRDPSKRHGEPMSEPGSDPADASVTRNDERSRYELIVDGEVRGLVDLREMPDGRVGFVHTEVDSALRGKGYSSVLVRRALDDVRARGELAVARCSYVRDFQEDHPEYADVFAS
ncbi:MAG: GNAT family N-acetyltransferase [Acidimicrobiia bacterium]